MPAPVRLNTYRIEGEIAYLDVATKAQPGAVAAIDVADLPKVLDGLGRWYAYKHQARPETYVRRFITIGVGKQRHQQLHRFLAQTDKHPVVIFRDYDGLNNRRDNLKATSREEMAAHARHSKTKYRGVFQREKTGRYRAMIGMDGCVVRLGTFGTALAAARAYDTVARKRYGDLARLNFPEHSNG